MEIDVLVIVERSPFGTVALFVDPVQPGGAFHFDNELDQNVGMVFDGENPLAGSTRFAPGHHETTFRQDAAPGYYHFSLQREDQSQVATGLRLKVDADGDTGTGFRVSGATGQEDVALVERIQKSGTVGLGLQTQPRNLAAAVQVIQGNDTTRVEMPRGKPWAHLELVGPSPGDSPKTIRILVDQAGFQGGGTRSAEVVIDPDT